METKLIIVVTRRQKAKKHGSHDRKKDLRRLFDLRTALIGRGSVAGYLKLTPTSSLSSFKILWTDIRTQDARARDCIA